MGLLDSQVSAALARAAGWTAGAAIAVDDAALGQVIGRHFDADGVADHRTDTKASHPSGGIGDQPMAIFKDDAEPPVDRKRPRLNSSHLCASLMPYSA